MKPKYFASRVLRMMVAIDSIQRHGLFWVQWMGALYGNGWWLASGTSDPQRKEENFTRPRGLGGKRPQRPSCRWNHPQGIPAESAFLGCTFGARTKGWRYYCTLRVPAVIGLLAKGIFGNNSRNEGKYFVFCFCLRRIAASNGGKKETRKSAKRLWATNVAH